MACFGFPFFSLFRNSSKQLKKPRRTVNTVIFVCPTLECPTPTHMPQPASSKGAKIPLHGLEALVLNSHGPQ